MPLPLGAGQYVVYGREASPRDTNAGLKASDQPLSRLRTHANTQEEVIYRTHSESEARKLVAEGGFTAADGSFYAATRYTNSSQAQVSGTLRRDDPTLQ